MDVSWGNEDDGADGHIGRLSMTITNQTGTLGTLSTVIGRNGGDINNLKITNRTLDFWDMLVDVKVSDTKHLSNIIAALRATPQVVEVERARGR